jgi:hypothetical protein
MNRKGEKSIEGDLQLSLFLICLSVHVEDYDWTRIHKPFLRTDPNSEGLNPDDEAFVMATGELTTIQDFNKNLRQRGDFVSWCIGAHSSIRQGLSFCGVRLVIVVVDPILVKIGSAGL